MFGRMIILMVREEVMTIYDKAFGLGEIDESKTPLLPQAKGRST